MGCISGNAAAGCQYIDGQYKKTNRRAIIEPLAHYSVRMVYGLSTPKPYTQAMNGVRPSNFMGGLISISVLIVLQLIALVYVD